MAELSQGLLFLTPPGRSGLRDALIEPADMAGYQFESSAMVEHMLDHLERIPGSLPLLQFAATKLWDARDTERRLLTEASYSQLGGIAGALAAHADAVLAEFPSQNQPLVRAIFLRLITPERTRAVVSMDELIDELQEQSRGANDIQSIVDHLVRARLLVIQTGDTGAGASVEIVHESLIHTWPQLGRWLDETQDDAAFLDQLRTAAKQWQAKGRPNGLLWRGEAMRDAQHFARRYRGPLPEMQRAYLHAVIKLAARSTRRKRWAIAITISFLSLFVIAASIALVRISDAEQQASDRADQIAQHLETIQAKEEERQRAQKRVIEALRKTQEAKLQVEQANQKLGQQHGELQQANQRLQLANRRSRRAKRRAQASARKAKLAAEEARLAESEAMQKQEELKRALVQLHRHARALQSQLSQFLEAGALIEADAVKLR